MSTVEVPSSDKLVDRMTAEAGLAALPVEELRWLAAHGELRRYPQGEVLAGAGAAIEFLWICLLGHVVIEVDRGAGPRRAFEWRAGDVGGLLPYSRMSRTPGTAYAVEPTEALCVHREHFPELIRECPAFAAMTVHVMLDRARSFRTTDLHDEKMVSLGRLSAGLAHELNNPASAAASDARMLISDIVEADAAARALGGSGLSAEELSKIERVRDICLGNPAGISRSVVERADREEKILAWLEEHGASGAHAAPLADTPVTLENLESLAGAVSAKTLDAALRWIATGCGVRALAVDIEKATRRIHELVSSIKRFSYMDRSAATEAVDIGTGLADTIAVLKSKTRAKSVALTLAVPPDLPPVRGTGGELNQVWLNILDNALDAVPESGTIEIAAERELNWVVVRITDDGPGVPAEVLSRIFDPFFTTKEPGEGTGMGLDIARRLVRQHDGEIDVHSEPGRTQFCVRLPVYVDPS